MPRSSLGSSDFGFCGESRWPAKLKTCPVCFCFEAQNNYSPRGKIEGQSSGRNVMWPPFGHFTSCLTSLWFVKEDIVGVWGFDASLLLTPYFPPTLWTCYVIRLLSVFSQQPITELGILTKQIKRSTEADFIRP